ncbi:MAG: glycine--tRNA ligase subunit beta [Thiolinea sp.]
MRPVHWVVLLAGDEVIEAEILGIRTGRDSYGHRFHAPEAIRIRAPADYAGQLQGLCAG